MDDIDQILEEGLADVLSQLFHSPPPPSAILQDMAARNSVREIMRIVPSALAPEHITNYNEVWKTIFTSQNAPAIATVNYFHELNWDYCQGCLTPHGENDPQLGRLDLADYLR